MVRYYSIVRILKRPNVNRDIDNMRRHISKSLCDVQSFITRETSVDGIAHLHICVMCADDNTFQFVNYIETHLYSSYIDKIKEVANDEYKYYIRYMCKDIVPESLEYIDYILPRDKTLDFSIYCRLQIEKKKAVTITPIEGSPLLDHFN